MKKLGQAIEEDLFVGLQGMDLNLETEALAGTGLVLDEQLNEFHCLWDDSFWKGPEQLHAIEEQLIQEGLLDRCVSFQACLEYIDLMETTQYMNEGELRILADTYDSVYFHPNSYSCACLALDSVFRLVDVVLGAEIWNGMASLGFLDIIPRTVLWMAIAYSVTWLWQPAMLNRNTTSGGSLWWIGMCTTVKEHSSPSNRTRVLYFFIHRYEQGRFWPHLKASNWSTTGFGHSQGYTINMLWNQVGMRDADYIAAFLHVLLLVILEFQPQLVLVAAGFDTLQGDPKGEMATTPAGFTQLTHLLMGLAGGKLTLFLEGGYNLRTLAEGISASLHTLLGDPCPIVESSGAHCRSAKLQSPVLWKPLSPSGRFF
ncbi:Histone deacetylase 6 [Saguinus oedipus]|uniref:Histone deacetylase 6 n=1 Tax=Saguinus oedipus TaxID=9490 RepID=A0ABQ9W376_SAGOE|nr:Histone deacetylase 6 [Saguinus oedipus]